MGVLLEYLPEKSHQGLFLQNEGAGGYVGVL